MLLSIKLKTLKVDNFRKVLIKYDQLILEKYRKEFKNYKNRIKEKDEEVKKMKKT